LYHILGSYVKIESAVSLIQFVPSHTTEAARLVAMVGPVPVAPLIVTDCPQVFTIHRRMPATIGMIRLCVAVQPECATMITSPAY
jgi:hypothetical protein